MKFSQEPCFVHLISHTADKVLYVAVQSNSSVPCIGIHLTKRQEWRFRPTDAGSVEAIRRLADVMSLSFVSSGTELFVSVLPGNDEERGWVPGQNPLVCIIPPGKNEAFKILQMMKLARMVATETLPCGGLLIHGALAERDGSGVIFSAPGGTGKTTASNRLPPPWRSLSDDAVLVVRDEYGNYFAHPWPTWSRFFDNGPGGIWEVERGVPLAAVFFLTQSPEDHAEPLNTGDAVAYMMESGHQIMGTTARAGCTREESELLSEMELNAVSELVKAIPAYILYISLTGTFWEEIDFVLKQQSGAVRADRKERSSLMADTFHWSEVPYPAIDMFGAGHIPVVYSGSSMNPTLRAPDLLDIVPYLGEKPAVGDIICFSPARDKKNIVHRIIRITGSGIQTQGDNNFLPDPDLVQEDQIIGRVIHATRAKHYRKIACGSLGRFTGWRMRTRKSVLNDIFKILRLAKPALVLTRAISRLLPGRWKPRIILFSSRDIRIMRLFFGEFVAGEFNTIRGKWTIRFPFQILVDEIALPAVEPPEPLQLQDIPRKRLNSSR